MQALQSNLSCERRQTPPLLLLNFNPNSDRLTQMIEIQPPPLFNKLLIDFHSFICANLRNKSHLFQDSSPPRIL